MVASGLGCGLRQLNVLVSDELFACVAGRAAGAGWSVARTVRVALEVARVAEMILSQVLLDES